MTTPSRLLRTAMSLVAFLLVLFPEIPTASADTITGGSTADWRTWVARDIDQDNRPYWDGNSWDSSRAMNIGSCLTGSGSCSQLGSGAPGAIPFWGRSYNASSDTGGTADSSFYFHRTSTQSSAVLRLEIAGNRDYNSFGWYDTTAALALHEIFPGSASPGAPSAVALFLPSANYGYYLRARNGDIYRTQSSGNQGDVGYQHFAVFRESAQPSAEAYWIGVEDLRLGSSDRDYQDLVVRVQSVPNPVSPVPEPASLLLTGVGLVGVTFVFRRVTSAGRASTPPRR